jgi:alkaline phosphatase
MMNQIRKFGSKRQVFLGIAVLLIILVTGSCGLAAKSTVPKYVFMFIGDGMGVAQRQIAELMLNSNGVYENATNQKKRLTMNSLEAVGINTTYDSTSIVPDSASTATSLSSGYKTWSGVLGMKEDKTTPTPYITEALKRKGYSIGIVSSVKIVHATPAAYYAHIDNRNKYENIAEQLTNSKFDLFVGGGGNKHFAATGRSDKRDLYSEAAVKGFRVVTTSEDFMALKPGKRVLANLPGDIFDEALPYAIDRKKDDLSLAQITGKCIQLLAPNPKGFFLMVEEGKVDWACHANDTGSAIANMMDFDKAITAAVQFKKKHPDTLIVVTGDHECGGLGLSMGSEYRINPELFLDQKLSFEMADAKVGAILKQESDPMEKICAVAEEFGLTNLTESEKKAIAKAVADEKANLSKTELSALYGGYKPVTMSFRRLFNVRANLYWTSYAHTGIPVMTTASGMGAAKFAGYMDNTDVCMALNSITKAGLKW